MHEQPYLSQKARTHAAASLAFTWILVLAWYGTPSPITVTRQISVREFEASSAPSSVYL
jgi:hypothetical protein